VRVLVLGGTGFVGGAVVRWFLEGRHEVAAFHRGESSGGAKTIRGDRKDLGAHRDEFRHFAPEVVIDTIAYTDADGHALIRAFGDIARRLVVLSSQDVYAAYGRLLRLESGPAEGAPATEDSPLRESRHPYRAMARPGEMAYDYDKILVESAARAGSTVPVTVLRLPKVYGVGEPRRERRPYLIRMLEGAREIRLDRAKAAWRWTRGAVEDVAAAIALAATDERASGRVYNLGEEQASSEAEWVRAIGEAAGWTGRVREIAREDLPEEEREPYDFAHHLVSDTGRIRRELGFVERVGRAESLRRAVAAQRVRP
jgi:nucleoside-diphosphate-sugar epimerase